MGLITAFIIAGLVVALLVAFSRIGSLERQVRELRESLERVRIGAGDEVRTRGDVQRAEDVAERVERRLPAHLKPVLPAESRAAEPQTGEAVPAEPGTTPPSPSGRAQPPPIPSPRSRAAVEAAGAKYQPAAAPARPTLEERAAALLRRLGPNDPDMSWEAALGTFWLPRIAAAFLSVSAVLFLTLALQRFGPGARIGIGYGATAALMGAAYWLERRYPAYARVLYGLGLALLYLVTFATYYFPPARVIDNPLVTLILLAVIISLFIGLAQYRRSPTIAVVSLLLGHCTVGLASFTLDAPGLYSGAGIFVLSLGGAYFLLRDRWYAIAAVGMVGSYANHFVLMMESASAGLVSEFVVGMAVLSGYYLIYALAELFSHEDARQAMPNWFRSAFVSVNTACYFGLGTLLVSGFEFSEDSQHVFRYALAVVLFLLGIAYLRFRGRDTIYNAYLTKGTAALSLGLAAQFSGATLTATLAVQMVVLLVSARRSGLLVTRVLAFLVAGAAFLHGLYTGLETGLVLRESTDYAARVIQYGIAVAAFIAASLIYERTNWLVRSPKRLPVSDATLDLLWSLDLAATPSADARSEKPLGGLLFPYIYSLAAGLLYLAFAYAVTEPGERFAVYAVAALVAVVSGRSLNSPPLTVLFALPLAAAFVSGTAEALGSNPSQSGLWAGAVPLLILGWLAEPRVAGSHRSQAMFHTVPAALAVHGTAAWVAVLYFTQLYETPAQLLPIAGAAVYYAAVSAWVTPRASVLVATSVLVAAHLLWYPYSGDTDSSFHAVSWLLAGLAVAGDRVFAVRGVPIAGSVLIASCVALLTRYVYVAVGELWAPPVWALLAATAAGYGAFLRSWTAVGAAGAVSVIASVQQIANAYPTPPDTRFLVAGFLATAALWIAGERVATRVGNREIDVAKAACVAAATGLLLCLLERSPALREFYLTISWSILGFALFGIALAFREKYYRYAGLIVILLASGRVLIIDTVNLEPMPRILAWFVLGLVMLVLGFGYVKAFPPARDTAENGVEG